LALLDIRGLSKSFNIGTPMENRVINGLDLRLASGEFATIIGSNGAGKSTLLNLVAGTLDADSGHISLDGEEVTDEKAFRRALHIGRVHQDPKMSVASSMTLLENLSLADAKGDSLSMRKAVDLKKVESYKERLRSLELGLEDKLFTKMGLLSGGQRQGVALLMAIMKKPKLLLLDEHTAALDPKTSEIIMRITERLVREDAITTLMITHNLKHAIDHGTRLLMMHEGKIVFDVSGEEKGQLTSRDLIALFRKNISEDAMEDRSLLSL
jgi:putative ABC transport system ATP-binding protein